MDGNSFFSTRAESEENRVGIDKQLAALCDFVVPKQLLLFVVAGLLSFWPDLTASCGMGFRCEQTSHARDGGQEHRDAHLPETHAPFA